MKNIDYYEDIDFIPREKFKKNKKEKKKIKLTDKCSCGSGKKYKDCCYHLK